MSTDFIAGAYAGVKALILGDTWLSTQGNGLRRKVWHDGADGHPDSRLPSKAPGDVAELELDWKDFSDDGRTATKTFGSQTSATCPYVGTQQLELEARITNKDTRITPVSAITTHLLDVLKSGATISVGGGGTARIGKVTSRSTIERPSFPDGSRGSEFRIVRVRIPITITYKGP